MGHNQLWAEIKLQENIYLLIQWGPRQNKDLGMVWNWRDVLGKLKNRSLIQNFKVRHDAEHLRLELLELKYQNNWIISIIVPLALKSSQMSQWHTEDWHMSSWVQRQGERDHNALAPETTFKPQLGCKSPCTNHCFPIPCFFICTMAIMVQKPGLCGLYELIIWRQYFPNINICKFHLRRKMHSS